MGKWSHLVGHYPERKTALVALKNFYADKNEEELEELVAHCYREQKRLEREAGEFGNKLEACSELLLEMWNEDRINAKKRSDIGNLSRYDSVHAHITDIKVFKEWAKSNGIGELIQETVNVNSLTSTIKEMIKDGSKLPEGVGVYTKSRIKPTTTT